MGFSEAFTVLAEASTARRVSGTLSGLGVAVVLVALSPIIMGCNTTETVYINPGGGGSTGGSTGEDAPTTTGTSNGSGTTGGETTGGPDDAGTSSTGTTGGDPVQSVERIRAVVQAVNPNAKLVVLNVGSNSKPAIKKGYRLLIYRGPTFVAAVSVTSVESLLCVAKVIDPPTGETVRVGDNAVTQTY